jgi:hypothetical protein
MLIFFRITGTVRIDTKYYRRTLYICIDNEEDWPDFTVNIFDKLVSEPELYLKLLKFKHKRLLKEENLFDKVFRFIRGQTKNGVKYHSMLKHFYKDVSEMPESVFNRWSNIIKKKKWLISEISDSSSKVSDRKY